MDDMVWIYLLIEQATICLLLLSGTDSNRIDDAVGHGDSDIKSVEASVCF